MHHRHYIRPGPINLAMNEALGVTGVRITAHAFAVQVIFCDVGTRYYAGWNVAGQEEVFRIALAAHADVAVSVQNSVHSEDVVRENQLIDLGSVIRENAHAQSGCQKR